MGGGAECSSYATSVAGVGSRSVLLPIGDEPNDPNHTPWMNYVLIAANGLVFAFTVTRSTPAFESLLSAWAYDPRDPTLATLFASFFLHAGFLHIFGNMLFLWIFGDNIEARLGPWLYLLVYLLLGCFGNVIHGLFAEAPVVGASGAVSGVQGCYFIACGRHRVRMLFWFYFFITVLHVNARIVMVFWFVMQDLIPTIVQMRVNVTDQVAHMAHIGGFVAGVVAMLILRRLLGRIARADAREWAAARMRPTPPRPPRDRRTLRGPYDDEDFAP